MTPHERLLSDARKIHQNIKQLNISSRLGAESLSIPIILGIIVSLTLFLVTLHSILRMQHFSLAGFIMIGYLVEYCSGKRENRLPTHLNIAERALQLLEKDNAANRYREIFEVHSQEKHSSFALNYPKPEKKGYNDLAERAKTCIGCALIKGASDEDLRRRAYNHFYSPSSGEGLPWHWYYGAPDWLTDFCIGKPPGEVFSSALKWAACDDSTTVTDCHDTKESGHPLNWKGAIEAYGVGNKVEAYERLGHVVHLLGDMAQPDHARLKPHPGSGCGGLAHVASSILSGIKGAAEGALIGAVAGAAIGAGVGYAKGGSKGVKDGAIAGAEYGAIGGAVIGGTAGTVSTATATSYEALINDEWTEMDNGPPSVAVKRFETLDEYFSTMAKQSVSESEQFESPLGLTDQLGVPLEPTIHSGDYKKYLDLASKLIPNATALCTGLLQFFHDIMRPPPYVKTITVSQDAPQEKIEYSGQVDDNIEEDSESHLRVLKGRTLTQATPPRPFSCGLPISIKIDFGPEGTRIAANSVRVQVSEQSVDGELTNGNHWEGTLEANTVSPTGNEEEIPIEIYAEDSLPHYQGVSASPRTESGTKLDTDATTPARVRPEPPYEWDNYESGSKGDWIDRNHSIKIAVSGKITVKVVSKKSQEAS